MIETVSEVVAVAVKSRAIHSLSMQIAPINVKNAETHHHKNVLCLAKVHRTFALIELQWKIAHSHNHPPGSVQTSETTNQLNAYQVSAQLCP